MFNKRTLTVIKRELRMKLLSRTFIIMTLLIPIFMIGIIGFQTFLYSYNQEQSLNLTIISDSHEIDKSVGDELIKLPEVMRKKYKLDFQTVQKGKFKDKLNELKKDIASEKISGVVFIPDSALINKKIEFYSKNPNNSSLFNKLRQPINTALISLYFANKELTPSEIDFARNRVDFTGYRVTSGQEVEEEGIGNTVISFLFSFLLYLSLIFMGQMTMNSVVEEKNNKIVEILLSSVSSNEMMAGKILGTTITGLLQMAIWLTPLVLIISTTWFVLPADFILKLKLTDIAYFLFNYFLALITFLGLFAAVGAIFDNSQDAQSGIWPLLMLIMIPFFIALSLQSNPNSPIATIASMFPFAALIVMPARISLMEVPSWQLILSIVISIAVMFSIFPIAGKIFRVGILRTGKKPKWSEIVKWLKYKY